MIGVQIQAQDEINHDVFKYTMTDEKKAFIGIKSIMNSSVSINNKLTASQNYTKICRSNSSDCYKGF